MEILLLIIVILTQPLQQVSRKAYYAKTEDGAYSFSLVGVLFGLLLFIIISIAQTGKIAFTTNNLGYSFSFAITYAIACIGTMLAINTTAPLSLTSLIISYSLIIPTFYGIIALKEPISAPLIIGIILLLASLALINLEDKKEDKKITLKWLIYIFITFVSNGICSTIQKVYMLTDGANKSEFTITGFAIIAAILLIMALITERKVVFKDVKRRIFWGGICGLSNGCSNNFILVLALTMPASLLYPLVSAGGIVLTSLVSIFVYKEKLSVMQYIGIALGIAAIVAFNI